MLRKVVKIDGVFHGYLSGNFVESCAELDEKQLISKKKGTLIIQNLNMSLKCHIIGMCHTTPTCLLIRTCQCKY